MKQQSNSSEGWACGGANGSRHLADTRSAVVQRLLEMLREAKSRQADLDDLSRMALTTFFPALLDG